MNKVVCVLCTVWAAVAVWGYSRQEQTAVACYLVERISHSPESNDCIDSEDTGSMALTYPTYESLFDRTVPEGCPGAGWTAKEKQQAFESFILDIPRLATTNEVKNLESIGNIALTFCDAKGTNALSLAMSILETSCPVCLEAAGDIVCERIVPSLEANAFIETAITNRPGTDCAESLASCYAAKLLSSATLLEGGIVSNGTRMLVRVRQKDSAARQLDKLLVRVYPEYASSSNRMEIVDWALQNLDDTSIFCDKTIRSYFSSITNILLNASHPLPEVEALRGL